MTLEASATGRWPRSSRMCSVRHRSRPWLGVSPPERAATRSSSSSCSAVSATRARSSSATGTRAMISPRAAAPAAGAPARRRLGRCLPQPPRSAGRGRTRPYLQCGPISPACSANRPPLLPAVEEAGRPGRGGRGTSWPSGMICLWRAVTETRPRVRTPRPCTAKPRRCCLDRGGSGHPCRAHLLESRRVGDVAGLAGLDRAVHEVLPTSRRRRPISPPGLWSSPQPSGAGRFARTVTAIYALTTPGGWPRPPSSPVRRWAVRRCPGRPPSYGTSSRTPLLLAGRAADAVARPEGAGTGVPPSELRGLAELVFFRGMFANQDDQARRRAESVVAGEEGHGPAAGWARTCCSPPSRGEGRGARRSAHSARHAHRGRRADQAQHAHPRRAPGQACSPTCGGSTRRDHLQLADEEVTALGHTTYAGGPAIFPRPAATRQGRFDDAIAEAQPG